MAVVADCSSANCFWQVVCYILTIEKDHEIDINDTDALWGETGIAFPLFPLELHVEEGRVFYFDVLNVIFYDKSNGKRISDKRQFISTEFSTY